jgi:cytochrome c-type biogenesis protein CcmH/NrfG
MNSQRNLNGGEMTDAELEQTLKNFRSSVHAWSEAAYSQPHVPVKVCRTSWRVAAGWALGCVLAVGSLSGGLYERHRLSEQAKIAAAAEAARQQKMEAEQRRQTEELAKIDADVSRDVPSAMEPLAQMMIEDSAQ